MQHKTRILEPAEKKLPDLREISPFFKVAGLGDAPEKGWEDSCLMKEFWDICHTQNSTMMLSGNSATQTIQNLRIEPFIKPGTRLLNIGVGTGACTQDYLKMGCQVFALDASKTALDKVRPLVHTCYLADNLNDLPLQIFDLAIAHLVAQHMEDDDLCRNLKAVIASLVTEGMYAIQFTYPLNSVLARDDFGPIDGKAGLITRPLSKFSRFVEAADGIITRLFIIKEYPEYGFGWYGCHIQKQYSTSLSSSHDI